MPWSKFTIGQTEHDLAHLEPITLTISPKSDPTVSLKVRVSFGCHTFTETWKAGDPAELKFVHGHEERRFCTTRYGHSVHLPDVVKGATKVFFTSERNYLIAENIPGAVAPYAVFFNIVRANAPEWDAAMFVVSAYEKPNLPPKKNLQPITMATLVGKTVRGEPIKPPPKRK